MDFVWSNFGTNELLPVEHFFPHFLGGLLCVRSKPAKKWGKSVQLVEVHLYRIYFLQNPYFNCKDTESEHCGAYISTIVTCVEKIDFKVNFIITYLITYIQYWPLELISLLVNSKFSCCCRESHSQRFCSVFSTWLCKASPL